MYKNIKPQISHLHKYSDPLLSTLLKHLWQRLQPQVFLDMTLQAWHTCMWGVYPILLCKTSQALSGWIGSVAAQLFTSLWSKLSSRISLYSGPLIFPSILTSLLVPAAENHTDSMMLPTPFLTVGMVPGLLLMCRLAFRSKS